MFKEETSSLLTVFYAQWQHSSGRRSPGYHRTSLQFQEERGTQYERGTLLQIKAQTMAAKIVLQHCRCDFHCNALFGCEILSRRLAVRPWAGSRINCCTCCRCQIHKRLSEERYQAGQRYKMQRLKNSQLPLLPLIRGTLRFSKSRRPITLHYWKFLHLLMFQTCWLISEKIR